MKLYSIDYNEQQKRLPPRTRHYSRNNFYVFYRENDQVDIDHYVEKHEIKSIIDYGCGYGHATDHLGIETQKFDPFIPEFERYPDKSADLVVAYNVLNVVEDQYIHDVINELYNLSKKIVLINVAVRENAFYGKRTIDYYIQTLQNVYNEKFEIIEYFNKREFDKRSFEDSTFYVLLKRKPYET